MTSTPVFPLNRIGPRDLRLTSKRIHGLTCPCSSDGMPRAVGLEHIMTATIKQNPVLSETKPDKS